MTIPGAFSDKTPAATVFEGQLYVAFKEPGSDANIRLASSLHPEVDTSWQIQNLSFNLPEPGPVRFLTDNEPALTVHHNRLWICFRGHNNPLIWLASMGAGGAWRGHGYLRNVQTGCGPSMDGIMVAHRGTGDVSGIWYTQYSVVGAIDQIIHGTLSLFAPAVATWLAPGERWRVLAFTNPMGQIKVTTQRLERIVYHRPRVYRWTEPMMINYGAQGDQRPSLAMHEGQMYLAFKGRRPVNSIWIGSYNGRGWVLRGTLPGRRVTTTGPSLVSYNGTLYVLFVENWSNQVHYHPVDIPSVNSPLRIMTVNIRVDEDGQPNTWKERAPRLRRMSWGQDLRSAPDIIGMQEVERKQLKSLRNNQFATYSCFAKKRGGSWNRGERLAIFYRSRRLQQLETGSATINHRRRRKKGGCEDTYVSTGDRDHSHRIIIWVRFRDLETDRTFYVFNAHFGGKDDCEKRGNSNFLIELIDNRSHAEDPFIILGDLNIGQTDTNTYDSVFLNLLRHTRLKSAYRRVHSENSPGAFTTINTYYPGNHQNKMIDFILIPPLIFQVRDADVDRSMFKTDGSLLECRRISRNRECRGRTPYNISDLRMYSDHWAVWTDLVWFQQ